MFRTARIPSSIFSVALLLLLIGGVAGVSADTIIIHTNDVHGYIAEPIGYNGLSAYVKECKAAGNDVVVVSAGDETQGLFSIGYLKGASAVELMNRVGYQAMVVGNHDVDYGWKRTVDLAHLANFPFLAANIFDEKTGELIFPASTIIKTSDLKIGIFGIATPETKTKSLKKNTEGLRVVGEKEMYDIAAHQVEVLRKQGCNYIICLSHLGLDNGSEPNRSIDLADHVSGIDLIVDGHSHTELPHGLMHAGTIIVSTGCNLNNIEDIQQPIFLN